MSGIVKLLQWRRCSRLACSFHAFVGSVKGRQVRAVGAFQISPGINEEEFVCFSAVLRARGVSLGIKPSAEHKVRSGLLGFLGQHVKGQRILIERLPLAWTGAVAQVLGEKRCEWRTAATQDE